MYTEISFPSLGLSFDPPRSIALGPLTIHFYGIIIATGLILAVVYACRRCKQFGITEDDLLDGVLWVTPFAILCARAYYCIFSWEQYAADPIRIFYIWEGGLAIYGGVLGAAIGVAVFCRIKKIKLPMLLDLVSLGFLIGQSIGRWGNFFNREAFGAETASFLRMGLMNAYTGAVTYYHPTFFYTFPRSGSMMARLPWVMWSGTASVGPLLKVCGPTAFTGVPSGSVSCWPPSAVPQQRPCCCGRCADLRILLSSMSIR